MSLSLSLSLFRSPDGVRRRKLWPGFGKGDQGEQWLLRTGSRHHQLSNWNNHQQLHYGGIPQSLVGTLLLSSSQSEARLHWRRCKSFLIDKVGATKWFLRWKPARLEVSSVPVSSATTRPPPVSVLVRQPQSTSPDQTQSYSSLLSGHKSAYNSVLMCVHFWTN